MKGVESSMVPTVESKNIDVSSRWLKRYCGVGFLIIQKTKTRFMDTSSAPILSADEDAIAYVWIYSSM